MGMFLLRGIISILLLQLCRSHDTPTSKTPLVIGITLPTAMVTGGQPEVTEPGSLDTEEDHGEVPAQHVLVGKTEIESEFVEEAAEEVVAQPDKMVRWQEAKKAGDPNGGQAIEAGERKTGANEKASEKVRAEILENVHNIGEVKKKAAALARDQVELRTEEGAGGQLAEGSEPEVAVGEAEPMASHKTGTEDDTYVPPRLHDFDAGNPQRQSNAVGREIIEESNYFNEILASNDEFANTDPPGAVPARANAEGKGPAAPSAPLLKEEPGDHDEKHSSSDIVALGTESWKIGGIFATVLLVLETAVIAVYCLKCKTRTIRRRAPAPKCQDCEAAQSGEWEPSKSV